MLFSSTGYEFTLQREDVAAGAVPVQNQVRMALDYIVAEGHDGRVTSPLRLCHTDTAPAGHLLGALQHQLAASVERVMELGAVDYITKPFAVDYLEETVDTKIARYLIYVKARRLNGTPALCAPSSIPSSN